MWKLLISVSLLISCAALFGQNRKLPGARLVSTFYKGDFLHANNEAALDLREFANMPGDRIAVRICSKEPLAVAITIASGRPLLLASNLINHGYSGKNILFLRAARCETSDPNIAVTQFWAVPSMQAIIAR